MDARDGALPQRVGAELDPIGDDHLGDGVLVPLCFEGRPPALLECRGANGELHVLEALGLGALRVLASLRRIIRDEGIQPLFDSNQTLHATRLQRRPEELHHLQRSLEAGDRRADCGLVHRGTGSLLPPSQLEAVWRGRIF